MGHKYRKQSKTINCLSLLKLKRMQYFKKDFLDFFIELAGNNNKDWFDLNRKRYENDVKEPFKKFVGDLILAIRKENPEIQLEAKDAIFRINRDIRFSNDKTPYKLNTSAGISTQGRKAESPGLFISFGPEKVMIGGGAYMIAKENLLLLREKLVNEGAAFEKLLASADFKSKFGEIQGQENKRLPSHLMEASKKHPLILKKQLYYMTDLEPEFILSENLLDNVIEYYKAAAPIEHHLKDLLGL